MTCAIGDVHDTLATAAKLKIRLRGSRVDHGTGDLFVCVKTMLRIVQKVRVAMAVL
jgi:hypothetical protein